MCPVMTDLLRPFDRPLPTLNDKNILVTGGTGSFGQAFVRHVLKHYSPHKLIIFSRDEDKHYSMAQEFPESRYPCMRYFIGDVRDQERLVMAFRNVDYVIHAAALKHVPAAEYNPFETLHTNVIGAKNIVQAAITANIKKVIALSTDKAANPINLYGASKLASDKIFVAANNLSGADGTLFSVVRYGNVVGSRGSVVPFFRKLISQGTDHLPITDERMTRFWISIEQGVNFVLSSLEMTAGGELFVPKLPSMKVVDLAHCMAPELPLKIVGIRPGEKLHEVMIPEIYGEEVLEMDDRYVILPPYFNRSRTQYDVLNPRPKEENFFYSSDTNPEWLENEEMQTLLDTDASKALA